MDRRVSVPLHRSIRTRITVAFALSALFVTLIVGTVVDSSVMTSGREQLRARAVDAIAAATATYDFTSTVPIGATVSATSAPAAVRAMLRPDSVVTWFDGRIMWAARRVDGSKILTVRVSGADLLAQRDHLHEILVALTVGVLALSIAAGWLIAGSLTRRLREAARRFAAPSGVRSTRVDEVGELILQIDGLTDALAARLDAERAFSADVAHELRTPLTALSAATELLPEGEEAALVRRQTLRLRRLVEDLLELARAERSFETHAERHDLGTLVTQILHDQDDVLVEEVMPSTLITDAALLDRVILNLVANARRHGAPPIVVTIDADTVAVSDAGAGFPAALLSRGVRRFGKHGAQGGVGLGLAIANAWAERLGGQLLLENLDPGARASLRFGTGARRDPESADRQSTRADQAP